MMCSHNCAEKAAMSSEPYMTLEQIMTVEEMKI